MTPVLIEEAERIGLVDDTHRTPQRPFGLPHQYHRRNCRPRFRGIATMRIDVGKQDEKPSCFDASVF